MSDIRSFVDTIFDELVSIRRDIHAHPELGMHEVRTSALIRSELEKMGVDEIRQPLPTAVVALIHGKKGPGKCVALRADIDALPVHEETGLPFASETEGIMHACGHDLHTTMLLGAAKTLCHMRDQFAGTVKLIFEPSEDLMPGGARALVAAGVMENPHVPSSASMSAPLRMTPWAVCSSIRVTSPARWTCSTSAFTARAATALRPTPPVTPSPAPAT